MASTGLRRQTGETILKVLLGHSSMDVFRLMTCKILTHISLASDASGKSLPGRMQQKALERLVNLAKRLEYKQKRTFERNASACVLRKLKISKVIEDEVNLRVSDVSDRSNYDLFRRKMRRRVTLKNQSMLPAPRLDFLARRGLGENQVNSKDTSNNVKRSSSEKPQPPEEKRLKIDHSERRTRTSVNPYDLKSGSQSYKHNSVKKSKQMTKNTKISLPNLTPPQPFRPIQNCNRGLNSESQYGMGVSRGNTLPAFIIGATANSPPDAADNADDAWLNFRRNNKQSNQPWQGQSGFSNGQGLSRHFNTHFFN